MQGTGNGCFAASVNVHDGTHGGAGAGQTAEQAGNHVADALADQFTVRLVVGAGDAVGDQ